MKFWTFASGSKSNCALVEHDGKGLLIDCGMSAKKLESCLNSTVTVDKIGAMILTHTHGDHWNAGAIRFLERNGVEIFVHDRHEIPAEKSNRYGEDRFSPTDWSRVTPIHLFHDSIATHGFRIDTDSGSLGYIADTGAWTKRIAKTISGCDILAIEANHDPEMQRNSGRHPKLIERVLGIHGHLSNRQCAAFCKEIVGDATKSVVLLHMSNQCNTESLAISEVRDSAGTKEVRVASGSSVTGPFVA